MNFQNLTTQIIVSMLMLAPCTQLLAETARDGTKDRPYKLQCCERPNTKMSIDFLSGTTPFNVSGPPTANVNTWSVKKNSSWSGSGGGGAQWIQPGTLAQNYSEVAPFGVYTYRWFFEVPQCQIVGAPPKARMSLALLGKVSSDNQPSVTLDGATIAASTDAWAFMPGHELSFSAPINPSPGIHVLSFLVTNDMAPASASQLATLTPAQLAAYQSMINNGQSPSGLSARASITQNCQSLSDPIPSRRESK